MIKNITPTFSIDPSQFIEDIFFFDALKSGYTHFRSDTWPVDLRDLPTDGLVYSYASNNFRDGIYNHGVRSAISRVNFNLLTRTASIYVFANRPEALEDVMQHWKKALPLSNPVDDHTVQIQFWHNSARGPSSIRRNIDVPEWSGIQNNYHSRTLENLSHLFNKKFKPSHGGQLLLWHGEPGTGKTYAIRSLAYEWRDWCDFEYVVDPDLFFGHEASYMVQVLMGVNQHNYYDDDEEEEKAQKWRCLIFEDTGELLSEDASRRSGQGLSRLLNVVDGLIGQGLKVLILITTNEELDSLHRAVSRPGRAAENVFFMQLDENESVKWAEEHEIVLPSCRAYTIAELYAIKYGMNNQKPKVEKKAALGFAPRQITSAGVRGA